MEGRREVSSNISNRRVTSSNLKKERPIFCQSISTFLQLFVVAREKPQNEPRPCLEGVVFSVRSDSFFWKITDKNIKRLGSQQWFPQHQKTPVKIHGETLRFCLCLELVVNLMDITLVSTKCRLQTAADHCLHHANDNVTTIIPLFSNTENNGLQSVCSLHFVQSKYYIFLERCKFQACPSHLLRNFSGIFVRMGVHVCVWRSWERKGEHGV